MRRPMMYITSIFAVLILFFYYFLPSFSAEKAEEEANIRCRIIQSEIRSTTGLDGEKLEYMYLKGYADEINGAPIKKEKILIKIYDVNEEIIPGRTIEISGTLQLPQGRRNPGCFDYALYLKSIGISRTIIAERTELCESNDLYGKVLSALWKLKEGFITELEKSSNEETASLMRAIMFGEKTDLEEETLEGFRRNGTAHVLAVSGLHVGMIYAFLRAVWIWKKGRLFFVVVILFFLVYMVMASFAPSVVRAVIMIWLHVFADMTNRRYDMASAAFFTAFLMLMHNPMHLFNAGFQMSFLAVLSLSLMLPIIKRFYSGVFLGSFAIQAGLTPYTIYVFNYFSLASIFVNVPIIFLTGFIVPMGLCAMVLYGMAASTGILQPVFDFVTGSLGGFCRIMTKLNEMTGVEGITVFDIQSPPLWLIALYYLILLVFVSEDGRLLFMRKKKKVIALLAGLVVSLSLVFSLEAGNHFKSMDVVFVDVGQGDCIHFRVGRNGDYLVDGGGSITYDVGTKTLKPYLLKNGAKAVDGAFVTHLHTDHYKGIAELCREGMVEKLFLYEGYKVREEEILEDTGLDREDIIYIYAGQTVMLGRDAAVEVLWPERHSDREYEKMAADEEDENAMSLIMKVNVKGRSVLATGDVDADCLDELARKYSSGLKADILKVAHHGSKYSDSDAFVEASLPEYSVIQVGQNNFGHPDKGIVEKFRQQGIIVYRNDTDGAVAFKFRKNIHMNVRTVRGDL